MKSSSFAAHELCKGAIDTKNVRVLVIDEADAMPGPYQKIRQGYDPLTYCFTPSTANVFLVLVMPRIMG